MTLRIFPTDRLAIFIDGYATYSACKPLNLDLDYNRICTFFNSKAPLIQANYYTLTRRPDEDDDYIAVKPLLDFLSFNGWHVVARQGREVTNMKGDSVLRGSVAVDLACDVLELAHAQPRDLHVILFAGSADYAALPIALHRLGVRLSVIYPLKSAAGGGIAVSDTLRMQSSGFGDLAVLGEHFRKIVKPAAVVAG